MRKSSLAAVHNYFFLKGMDTLREGGILAYITTSGVMDSPQNRPVREWLVNHANLVSTIRLPDNLFTDVGTEVGSDLIVLQKNTRKSELTEKERTLLKPVLYRAASILTTAMPIWTISSILPYPWVKTCTDNRP